MLDINGRHRFHQVIHTYITYDLIACTIVWIYLEDMSSILTFLLDRGSDRLSSSDPVGMNTIQQFEINLK